MSRPQVIPGGVAGLGVLSDGSADTEYPQNSPSVENVIAMLKQDMLPLSTQEAILNAMSPTARRALVHKISGLDASVLETFKKQIQLVDNTLRRIVNDDGTPTATYDEDDPPMALKDALNLSLRVTQILVKDLPKIYGLERIQRQEEALRRVMESHMTPDQQEALLEELERISSEK